MAAFWGCRASTAIFWGCRTFIWGVADDLLTVGGPEGDLRRRKRRTRLAVAVAVAAALGAIARVWVLHQPGPARSGRDGVDEVARTRVYPAAIVARIPVSGVISLVASGPSVWVVRGYGQAGASMSYQLVEIAERTNKVILTVNLRFAPQSVAAAQGLVWLATGHRQALGQLIRINPATGGVMATEHLAVGRCGLITFSSGSLWAVCADGGSRTEFLRVDPRTGQVTGRAGPVRGLIGSIAAADGGIWYGYPYLPGNRRTGLVVPHGNLITVHDPTLPVSLSGMQPLVYAQGYVWALSADENVAKIEPVTGRVLRVYTHRTYDPELAGGLDFFAIGQGSLWFLDDGYPFSGVLRISLATGRPLGAVAEPKAGDCGPTPCAQIYSTPGAIWVPTAQWLLRIDPARLPG